MRIIRPRQKKPSRYATLSRPGYTCPTCFLRIIRDREEDRFFCRRCGFSQTREEFASTLQDNLIELERERIFIDEINEFADTFDDAIADVEALFNRFLDRDYGHMTAAILTLATIMATPESQ